MTWVSLLALVIGAMMLALGSDAVLPLSAGICGLCDFIGAISVTVFCAGMDGQ